MAAVHTLPAAMTLGQQNKMYNVMHHQQQQHQQQHSPQQTNCVIVSTGMTPMTTKSVIQNKRPLAPAPERSSVLVTNNSDLRCKRKIQFSPYGVPPQQPASVARRNARERNRVKQVNNGFATLRQHIPQAIAAAFSPQQGPATPAPPSARGASKKLSKVETLRLAVEYIRSLQQMIDEHEDLSSNSGSENNMMDSRYYSANSPDSMNQQQYNYPILLPTPACSEASTSPTPSQGSDGSLSASSNYTPTNAFFHSHENYENYEPKSPEDEELLEAIYLWQGE